MPVVWLQVQLWCLSNILSTVPWIGAAIPLYQALGGLLSHLLAQGRIHPCTLPEDSFPSFT